MNIAVFESRNNRQCPIKSGFETLEDAAKWAHEQFDVLYYEADPYCENAGDLITKGGEVYAIEPL